jgi:hypothetical protein
MSVSGPFATAIAGPVAGPLTAPGIGGGAAPSLTAQVQALFAATSASGFMFDQLDSSTAFQTSAGTGAVVLDSPIGKRLDLSGNNNHRTQATAASRPTQKADGELYDGIDDGMLGGANTAAGGLWTYVARLEIQNTLGILIGQSWHYLGYWHSLAAVGTTGGAGSPSLTLDGAPIADGEALYAAGVGAKKTMLYTNLTLDDAVWGSSIPISSYGLPAGVKMAREVLINAALTGEDLATLIAFVEET